MRTKVIAGRECPVVDLPDEGLVLEDHTEFAAPAVRKEDELWTIVQGEKTIGLLRRVGEDWYGEVYCGHWKRSGGWPLRDGVGEKYETREACARGVADYHRFGEADEWTPGFASRYYDLRKSRQQ